jgi:hypothetical protein
MAAADAIVCHGGSGTLADALALGRTPAVLPRLRRFGEHVNDHQIELWSALRDQGRIVALTTPEEIAAGVDEVRQRGRARTDGAERARLPAALRAELARARARGPRRGLLDFLEGLTRRVPLHSLDPAWLAAPSPPEPGTLA